MTTRSTLKQHQLEVLEWISRGCPDGEMSGSTYKTIAAALHNRRLVRITRRRGGWSASITPDGTFYLAHGRYPDSPPSARRLPSPPPVVPRDPKRQVGQRGRAPVEALVEEVIAAGGELHVNRREDQRQFSNLVKSAIRFGKVPAGKILTVESGRRWEELVIRLTDRDCPGLS